MNKLKKLLYCLKIIYLQIKHFDLVKEYHIKHGKAIYISEFEKINGIPIKDIILNEYCSLDQIINFLEEEFDKKNDI